MYIGCHFLEVRPADFVFRQEEIQDGCQSFLCQPLSPMPFRKQEADLMISPEPYLPNRRRIG